MNFTPVIDSIPLLLEGLQVTVTVSVFGFAGALLLGIVLGLASTLQVSWVRFLVGTFVYFFRGTPLIVLLFLCYFGLPQLGIGLSAIAAGTIALVLNSAAYISEMVRSAVESVDKSQHEAASLDGATAVRVLFSVVFPQVVRQTVAPITNEAIALLKNSSLLAVISVADVTRSAQLIAGRYFIPFETYIVLALVYLALAAVITWASRALERRLARSMGEAGSPQWFGKRRRPRSLLPG